ncbi:peptidoglycan editing factor PgeF [Candidatus Babeliales bacterium]|nr:peptidoglycan editing factor PgeF [Candidatus Babeliales bacterium]MCF7899519.1 peptidoglycan editing factor PgeF [Candidatus Babeliales bacterium]
MVLHNASSYLVCFGDKNDCCVKSYINPDKNKSKISGKLFDEVRKSFLNFAQINKIVFLKQVHGANGLCITDLSQIPKEKNIFDFEGDFIITNLHNIAIGVLTADCLPIVLYDKIKNIAAIVHAGWKGLVANIIGKVFEKLQKNFDSNPTDILVFWGPCAGSCCYEVNKDFFKNLEKFYFFEKTVVKKQEKMFFNLICFAKLQLLDLGVATKNMNFKYNNCTICDNRFFSYRLAGPIAGRQATVIVLK